MKNKSSDPPESSPSADRLHWRLLALAVVLPLGVAIVLFALDVPLGQPGKFVYLYSPIVSQRLAALPWALSIAVLLGIGTWLAYSCGTARRRAGLLIVWLGCVAAAAWVYPAPPAYRSQHLFNMQSPSHDGAFLIEAHHVRDVGVRDYLSEFPDRASTPTEQMRGTRVISNPPGTTLVAVATLSLLERSPWSSRAVYRLGADQELPPEYAGVVVTSTGFALALSLLWLLAAPLLYWLARIFFPPPTAAVFAVICFLSPATLLFVPGKDPAQLLTVTLPLWLWLLAWRGERSWVGLLAGAAFVLSLLVSLVHVWIAVIVVVATMFATPAGKRRRFVWRVWLPSIGGAAVVVGALAVFAELNLFAALWSVARAQAEVTRGTGAMPLVWQMLGVPLFPLFAGPALWFVVLSLPRQRSRDADARFGLFLMAGSIAVMLATVGFTNIETPRLWIPFTPLLLLGGALQLPMFRNPGRGAAVLLAVLVFAQLAASAAQWSLMDARETEMRLIEQADGGARLFH